MSSPKWNFRFIDPCVSLYCNKINKDKKKKKKHFYVSADHTGVNKTELLGTDGLTIQFNLLICLFLHGETCAIKC